MGTSRPTPEPDAAEAAELAAIAELPEDERAAVDSLVGIDPAELAPFVNGAADVDPAETDPELAAIAELPDDERAAVDSLVGLDPVELAAFAPSADKVEEAAAEAPEAERTSIPGQPGHPPLPNEGHPGVAKAY